MANLIRRRDVAVLLGGLGVAGIGAARAGTEPHRDEGLMATAEAIHQEIDFAASAAKIYGTLLDAKAFDAVTALGRAAKTGQLAAVPAKISPDAGGAFALFGGYIVGRHVELVPDTRIVQAWREQSWPGGAYSLATFALRDQPGGARLTFDQTGFPCGAGAGVAPGWYADYWDPLRKYLG